MIDFSSEDFNSLTSNLFSLLKELQNSWIKLSLVRTSNYYWEKIPEILPSYMKKMLGNSNWLFLWFLWINLTDSFWLIKRNLSLFNCTILEILSSTEFKFVCNNFSLLLYNLNDDGWLGILPKGLKIIVYPFN